MSSKLVPRQELMVVARVGIEPTSQVFQTRAVTNLATSPWINDITISWWVVEDSNPCLPADGSDLLDLPAPFNRGRRDW